MKSKNKIDLAVYSLFCIAVLLLIFVYSTQTSQIGNPNSFLASVNVNYYDPPKIPVDGECGSENGRIYKIYDDEPDASDYGWFTENFCRVGGTIAPTWPGYGKTVRWTCSGLYDGKVAKCSATILEGSYLKI